MDYAHTVDVLGMENI